MLLAALSRTDSGLFGSYRYLYMLNLEMGHTEDLALKTTEKKVRHGASFWFYATWAKSWTSLIMERNGPGNPNLQSNTSGYEWFKALAPVTFVSPSCSPNWKDEVWVNRLLPTRNSSAEREGLLLGWTDALSASENPHAKSLTPFYPRTALLWFSTSLSRLN